MELQFFSKTLANGFVVNGMARSMRHLSALFQIKCREYDLSDGESLAVWLSDEPVRKTEFFKSQSEADRHADSGFKKLINSNANILNLE